MIAEPAGNTAADTRVATPCRQALGHGKAKAVA